MESEPDDEAAWWVLDRGVSVTAWSGAQLDAMELLTAPGVGSSRCEGRVSVALDGTWRCTDGCGGPPTTHHIQARTVDCSAGTAIPCCCWHCLEVRTAP